MGNSQSQVLAAMGDRYGIRAPIETPSARAARARIAELSRHEDYGDRRQECRDGREAECFGQRSKQDEAGGHEDPRHKVEQQQGWDG